jgi:VWFA-related protein
LLREARITLYCVDPVGAAESVGRALDYEVFMEGLRNSSQAEFGDLALQVLAVQSGGQAFSGSNDVGGMLKSAYEDGSAYYELTFNPTPAEHPDEYHQIEVKVSQPGLTARTRQGYYNQP